MFGWIIPLIRIPHTQVLEKVGLDAVVVSKTVITIGLLSVDVKKKTNLLL
jgi:hypothetical protein